MTTVVNFVLDRSGSMGYTKNDTIGGFNDYIETLRNEGKGAFRFFLTQFDSVNPHEIIYDGVPLKDVTPLDFHPRGGTPLFDAVGESIVRVAEKTKNLKNPNRLVVILTDGQENSSHEYTSETLNKLIKEKEEENWTFVYLAVEEDAWDKNSFMAGTQSFANVTRSRGGQGRRSTMANLAQSTVGYSGQSAGAATVVDFYSPEQKEETENA